MEINRRGEHWVVYNNGATAQQLRDALAAFNAELVGGPAGRIAAALMQCVSVTRRPSHIDQTREVAYLATIQEAMMDYPVEMVEGALKEWRKGPNGEWWPAEAELRRLCEAAMDPLRRLGRDIEFKIWAAAREEEHQDRAERPSYFAGDKHKRFRVAMRERLRPSLFEALFDSSQIKYAGEDVILVRAPIWERVLTRDGGDLLAELGLTVRFCAQTFLNEPPPQGKLGEEIGEEERAKLAQSLRDLAASMRAGTERGRTSTLSQRFGAAKVRKQSETTK